MVYNLENVVEPLNIYKLMSNLVVPRPIAWISTISENNIANLAPFSYFTPLSSNPPTFLISIGHKPNGEPKDTLKNLRDTKRCSISIADTDLTQQMHDSAKPFEYNISEFKELNIAAKEILKTYPKVPEGIKVAFLGKYLQEVELKSSKTIPVIIEIEHIFVDDTLLEDSQKIKLKPTNPIARVGAKYFTIGKEINID